MNTINIYITEYMEYCQYRKHLDSKTIKAYKIDLKQYTEFSSCQSDFLSRKALDLFITELHKQYKPKTVKRKIASLKAFLSSIKSITHLLYKSRHLWYNIAILQLNNLLLGRAKVSCSPKQKRLFLCPNLFFISEKYENIIS